jgi:hypothetical protein
VNWTFYPSPYDGYLLFGRLKGLLFGKEYHYFILRSCLWLIVRNSDYDTLKAGMGIASVETSKGGQESNNCRELAIQEFFDFHDGEVSPFGTTSCIKYFTQVTTSSP